MIKNLVFRRIQGKHKILCVYVQTEKKTRNSTGSVYHETNSSSKNLGWYKYILYYI